jgi:hypothetical protein
MLPSRRRSDNGQVLRAAIPNGIARGLNGSSEKMVLERQGGANKAPAARGGGKKRIGLFLGPKIAP